MNKVLSMNELARERRLELSNKLVILGDTYDELESIIKNNENIIGEVLREEAIHKAIPLLKKKKELKEQVSRTANWLFHNLHYIGAEQHTTIIAGKKYTDEVIRDANVLIEKSRKLLPRYINYA